MSTLTTRIDEAIGQAVTVVLDGGLDVLTGPHLVQYVTGIVREGWTEVVLDLESLEVVDSTGLGSLIACVRNASMTSAKVSLRNVPDEVGKLLDLTGLNKVVTIIS